MVLYLLIVAVFAVVTLGFNGLCALTLGLNFTWGAIWTVAGLGILLGVNLCLVLFMRCLPKKLYNPFAKIYQTQPWQTTFCIRLGVRRWKEKVPELGRLAGFRKDHVDSFEPAYLYRFLQENTFAEAEHVTGLTLSWVMLLLPWPYGLTVGIPYCLLGILLNGMSAMTQRYLRPKLIALYRRQLAKAERAQADTPTAVAA